MQFVAEDTARRLGFENEKVGGLRSHNGLVDKTSTPSTLLVHLCSRKKSVYRQQLICAVAEAYCIESRR